jgi:heme exporter protein A
MSLFEGHGLACIRGERLVFRDLDFALPAGGALLLTGPNGSGKSSLLRLLAGLARPAAGALWWDETLIDRDRDAHCRRLHYLSHLDAVKPVLTALENLAFWAALRGAGRAEAMSALERFGLEPLAEVPARMLSAGQKRRLALARMLAAPAELWLLDEPATGLDRESMGRLEEALAQHRAGGGRAVVTTHTAIALPDAAELDLSELAQALAEAEADEGGGW